MRAGSPSKRTGGRRLQLGLADARFCDHSIEGYIYVYDPAAACPSLVPLPRLERASSHAHTSKAGSSRSKPRGSRLEGGRGSQERPRHLHGDLRSTFGGPQGAGPGRRSSTTGGKTNARPRPGSRCRPSATRQGLDLPAGATKEMARAQLLPVDRSPRDPIRGRPTLVRSADFISVTKSAATVCQQAVRGRRACRPTRGEKLYILLHNSC